MSKKQIYNCSDCDYCYSNETMHSEHICVNGYSEKFGQLVDWLGLAEEDEECVVINGKTREEILKEDDYE